MKAATLPILMLWLSPAQFRGAKEPLRDGWWQWGVELARVVVPTLLTRYSRKEFGISRAQVLGCAAGCWCHASSHAITAGRRVQHAAVWRGPARLSARARLARDVLIAMLRIPLNAGTAPEQLFNLLRASIYVILSGCFLGEIGGIAAKDNN